MKDQMVFPDDEQLLLTLDCTAYPRQGLVLNAEGSKAMCSALSDILWFCDFIFPPLSGTDGWVKMTVTRVEMGQGACSANCYFCVEIISRGYQQEEVLKTIRKHTFCSFVISAYRLKAEGAIEEE